MSKTIDIQITLDAIGIMSTYSNPSKNQSSPTGIIHSYAYMVANQNVLSGNGTGDLTIHALVGDTVNFSSVSASNNRVNSALIYEISRYNGANVFTAFSSQTQNVKTAVSNGNGVIPPIIKDESFSFLTAKVKEVGTENYRVIFALYTRENSRQPVLFGYFSWDPTIVVHG